MKLSGVNPIEILLEIKKKKKEAEKAEKDLSNHTVSITLLKYCKFILFTIIFNYRKKMESQIQLSQLKK